MYRSSLGPPVRGAGIRDGALLLRIQAPPVEGAAEHRSDRHSRRSSASTHRAVDILSGHHSRRKRVAVAGIAVDAARRVLEEAARALDRARELMVPRADFVIEDADLIVTCAGPLRNTGRPRGTSRRFAARVDCRRHDGTIVFVGPADSLARNVTIAPGAVRVDARGCSVVPGFVDPHTHLVFAGDRREELQQPALWRDLCRDRGRRRWHSANRRRDHVRRRRMSCCRRAREARRDGRARHHDLRSQERLWLDARYRAASAARHQASQRRRIRWTSCHVPGRARGPAGVSGAAG